MGVVAGLDDPFLWGSSGISIEVPGTYDVAIDGHGYMINTVFEFGRRDSFRHSSIPAQRDATDITNQPGEACVDEETEILTQRGWLTHDLLKTGDVALTLNMGTQMSEWQEVTDVSRWARTRTDTSLHGRQAALVTHHS